MSGFAKRTLRRKTQQAKRELLALAKCDRLENSQEELPPVVGNIFVQDSGLNSIELEETISIKGNNSPDIGKPVTLHEKLANWYRLCNVTRSQLENLLKILRSENIDVPLSAKGLVKQKTNKAIIRTVTPGQYTHIGIKPYLRSVEEQLLNQSELMLNVNVDGLPLYKSSQMCVWPSLNLTHLFAMLLHALLCLGL